jgi:arsenate reductase (thioredoxin)
MRRYRVLFVCIGNACRSQMAEAFARAYGSDILVARSAGLFPAGAISSVTRALMLEKNIGLDGCVPKSLDETGTDFYLIVNMSGEPFPVPCSTLVREWDVEDPVGFPEDLHRKVRDRIETLVRDLIGEFRQIAAGIAPDGE